MFLDSETQHEKLFLELINQMYAFFHIKVYMILSFLNKHVFVCVKISYHLHLWKSFPS